MNYKYRIRKGDKVIVLTGKDKGKTALVVAVDKDAEKAVLEGLNVYKKHAKPSKQFPQGGIMDIPKPIEISNLMLICPACSKPSKVGFKNKAKDKRRYCLKCKEVVNAKS